MGDETVKVVVRMRPPNEKEKNEGREDCVTVTSATALVSIRNPADGDVKSFTFDAAYDPTSTQRGVYEETAFALVESVLQGFNGTIFAYGQTGSGKTWSMAGRSEPPELRGITPNSFDHIFEYIKSAADKEFLVRCSFMELYNEEVRDLLGPDVDRKLDLRENPDGVYVQDLTYVVVDSNETIEKVLNDGNKKRTVGATAMNAESSRSHSIFTVIIEASESRDGRDCITRGKLNLVDLAGSERLSKTGATGSRMKEGIKINLSLTALGNVIQALVDGKTKHIPYRDSKLTRLLSDSLGGNTRTVMLAAINSADYNYEETLSTLRYANRAKNIKNKPVINEDPKDTLLRQYKEEIEKLKSMLAAHMAGAGMAPETMSAFMSTMGGGGVKQQLSDMTTLVSAASTITAPGPAPAATTVASEVVPVTSVAPVTAVPGAAAVVVTAVEATTAAPQPGTPAPPAESSPAAAPIVVGVAPEALEAAQREAEREKREREELSRKLLALQNMLLASGIKTGKKKASRRASAVGGASPVEGGADEALPPEADMSPEVLLARQQHEHRRAQARLRAQKKKEAKLLAEQAALAEEKAAVEDDMRLLSDNVAALSSDLSEKEKIISKLRGKDAMKVESVRREWAEAAEEWRITREGLVGTIRDQAREMKLLEAVVLTFMTQRELGRVWERATFDEDMDRWILPQMRPKAGWRVRSTGSSPYAGGDGDDDGGAVVFEDGAMPPLVGAHGGGAPLPQHAYRGASQEGMRASASGLPNIGAATSSRSGSSRTPSRPASRVADNSALPALGNGTGRNATPAGRPGVLPAGEDMSSGLPALGARPRSSAAGPAPASRGPGANDGLPALGAVGTHRNTAVMASAPVDSNAGGGGGGTLPFMSAGLTNSGYAGSTPLPIDSGFETTSGPAGLPSLDGGRSLQPVAPPRDRAPSRGGTRRPRPGGGVATVGNGLNGLRGGATPSPTSGTNESDAFPSLAPPAAPMPAAEENEYPDDFTATETAREAPTLPTLPAPAPPRAANPARTPRGAAAAGNAAATFPTLGGSATGGAAVVGASKQAAKPATSKGTSLPSVASGSSGTKPAGGKVPAAKTGQRGAALPTI